MASEQQKLKKKLDAIVSVYVRKSAASKTGMAKCYTCPNVKHWKELQCGHFISRQYLVTRFDLNNLRPQCVGCNLFGHGQPLIFEERLKKEIGARKVEAMKRSRHKLMLVDSIWYEEQIATYKEKVKSIGTVYEKRGRPRMIRTIDVSDDYPHEELAF